MGIFLISTAGVHPGMWDGARMAIVNEISQCHNSGLSVLSRESVISHLPYVNMHVCKCVSVHLCTDLFACHQNGSLERTLKLRLWRLLTEPVVKEVKKKKNLAGCGRVMVS